MEVKFKKPFTKKFDQLPKKLQAIVSSRVELFISNPLHLQLNNHALKGKYRGFRSINITGDWRAIFRETGNYQLVTFETIGTHNQLYR
ncbi:MAG: type II toxin-antitoxin system mRNA interferase toxin, RelE/StbE family [Candidatus Doudnabacteria bacterium]|nr:type II toxin-antitoxin system mRNA interferase toxin, RelE/StbE family [bacterium]MDZ4243684.1 type II toxin-antitoxin system mRNA interferase toxin, RelE/StbE family [Candidatus Doudnabacteria bacterium]